MPKVQEVFEEARKSRRTHLLEAEAKAVCLEYGIPCARFIMARNIAEAIKSAEEIGYPVVLKVISPQIVHKSEVGGVVTGIRNKRELETSYRNMLAKVRTQRPDVEVIGALVQEMVPTSIEVVVGATKNPQFGPVIMFGLGGILVELLRDVSFRAAPINSGDAKEMITELKAYPVLSGYRGQPPVDLDALVKILLEVSALVTEHPEIREIDLNPILASERGAKAVDARIQLD